MARVTPDTSANDTASTDHAVVIVGGGPTGMRPPPS